MGRNKDIQIDIMNDTQIIIQMFQSYKYENPQLTFGKWLKLVLKQIIKEKYDKRYLKNASKFEISHDDEIEEMILSQT